MTEETEYECISCGYPETGLLPVHRGCPHCGSQDEIVPKGTRKLIEDHPDEIEQRLIGNVIELSIRGTVFRRIPVADTPGLG